MSDPRNTVTAKHPVRARYLRRHDIVISTAGRRDFIYTVDTVTPGPIGVVTVNFTGGHYWTLPENDYVMTDRPADPAAAGPGERRAMTVDDLRRTRELLAAYRALITAADRSGHTIAEPVLGEEAVLGRLIAEFDIPCLNCRRPVPHETPVDDPHNAVPNTALCGPCASPRR